MEKRAVILAGGKGTRLRPYTAVLPKPLMPIGEYPILEIVIRQLAKHGFNRITLAVNHQAELIQAFFGDGSKWNINIDYSMEDKPLSTMAPLKLIQDLPGDFLVMNGDVLTDLDFSGFFRYHVQNRNIFTISAFEREVKIEYGVLEENPRGRLKGFREKPVLKYRVSMGIYIVNKSIIDFIPDDRPYGFDHLMNDLIAKGSPASLKLHSGLWLDIGSPDDYSAAVDVFERNRDSILGE